MLSALLKAFSKPDNSNHQKINQKIKLIKIQPVVAPFQLVHDPFLRADIISRHGGGPVAAAAQEQPRDAGPTHACAHLYTNATTAVPQSRHHRPAVRHGQEHLADIRALRSVQPLPRGIAGAPGLPRPRSADFYRPII